MNHCGINSTLHHAPGLVLLLYAMPVTLFSGWGCCTLLESLGITPLDFFLVGQLCLDQIISGPLPHPKNHHRDYIEGIPLNARISGA